MFCQYCESFIAGWTEAAALYHANEHGQIDWRTYSEKLHPDVSSLIASSDLGCVVCRNMWHTLTQYEQADIEPSSAIFLEVNPDQGRPVLKAKFERPGGISIVRMVGMFLKLNADPAVSTVLRECGQMDRSSTSADASFHIAKFWLDECRLKHTQCPKQIRFLPTRVIDVGLADGSQEPHLVESRELSEAERELPFIALSHCWGKERFLTTTRANLQEHKGCISYTKLPPSFQDAVTVVRRLGFRYLWIDSLCILQGDLEDWEQESVQMCNIYAQAIFTITSAHASGAFGGMFVERDGTRTMPFEIELKLPSNPVRIMYVPTPQRQVQWQLDDLPLYTRAWCFQEMMLTTRNLIYDPDGIRWECLTTAGTEGNLEAGVARYTTSMKLYQNAMKEPISSTDFFAALGPDVKSVQDQAGIWQSIIRDYAARDLTKYTDKLIAIAGVAQEAEKRTKNKYLAGLWQSQLFMNLLWYVETMTEPEGGLKDWFRRGFDLPYRVSNPVSPTWSWASVNVPISYDVSPNLEAMCEVLNAEVDGPPHIQTGRLTIRGDTRQLYVLRPENSRVKSISSLSDKFQYKDSYSLMRRLLDPNETMLATPDPPSSLSRSQALHVTWQPEDTWSESEPITFLAITRHPILEGMPLDLRRQSIYTLALVPTGRKEGEYRRVGLAKWYDCTWFAYACAEDQKLKASAWKKLGRSLGRIKPPLLEAEKKHEHPISHAPLPSEQVYHAGAGMKRVVVEIV